ncbi:hypothetical protein [Rubinisphaera margarita]|uniref:hypothetical protein n=1 Tax=Rubinisphaera margarita TaxID=2909586 RepID=UPI001EE97082|nr:hypothetical protein [Rubinisphaera margarita]MCG6154752.1 hypothetical protein [Rubinisphaera margarita]
MRESIGKAADTVKLLITFVHRPEGIMIVCCPNLRLTRFQGSTLLLVLVVTLVAPIRLWGQFPIPRPQRPYPPMGPPGAAVPGPPPPNSFVPPAAEPPVDYRAAYQGEVHFEFSEQALKTLLARQDVNSSPVQEVVPGAVIDGLQTTQTRVDIDCQPSQEGAKFLFIVNGHVESTITARTAQAEVLQQGNSVFTATKPVLLDGEKILTQKAVIQVMPNQRVMNARTPQGRLPIFGRLADRIAYNAAVARTPQSNMIAGQRMLDKLQPQLDSEFDRQLSEADRSLQNDLWARLEDWNVAPQQKSAFSSADRLYWDYRLTEKMIPFNVAVPLPDLSQSVDPNIVPAPSTSQSDLEVHLHESLFATIAAKRSLAGRVISLNNLKAIVDRFLSAYTDEDVSSQQQFPVPIDFRFAETAPLVALFEEDHLSLQLRGTFQAGNLPGTEIQQIHLKISASFDDSHIVFRTVGVDVFEEDKEGNPEPPGLTQSAIASQLKAQLQPMHLPRTIPLPQEKFPGKAFRAAELNSGNGWLIASFVLADTAVPLQSPVPSNQPVTPIPNSLTPVPDNSVPPRTFEGSPENGPLFAPMP